MAATYQLNANFDLFARINNLFDRTYQNPEGFLQPPLGAFAGVKVKF